MERSPYRAGDLRSLAIAILHRKTHSQAYLPATCYLPYRRYSAVLANIEGHAVRISIYTEGRRKETINPIHSI